MMAKEKQKRFLLRMDESLFAKLSQAATTDGRSINAYIINILSKTATPGNWESRQLIGRTVPGTALDAKTGLVLVAGIYYRYLLEPREALDFTANYTIIESNGNILTFKKI
ncbi:toxin-antitoxin system HicB family antitoxin [Lactobacillus sp. ZJLC28-8]|nr:toxin-antitoxin system HicB family antitoxin [Lactobacillus sp. HBUAS51381]